MTNQITLPDYIVRLLIAGARAGAAVQYENAEDDGADICERLRWRTNGDAFTAAADIAEEKAGWAALTAD